MKAKTIERNNKLKKEFTELRKKHSENPFRFSTERVHFINLTKLS